jgi:uncharacterized metal-binding protein YceD (DUF177 family)
MTGIEAQTEFSRVLAIDPRREHGRFAIEASASECAALASRFSLPAIGSLKARGEVRARPGGRWRLTARIEAEVTQLCVATLVPVGARIDERFEIDFTPPPRADAAELDIGAEDAEPLPDDGRLDVGEIVAQHFYLALDPFPRAPDAAWTDHVESVDTEAAPVPGDGASGTRPSPFAVLARRETGGAGGSGEA